MSYISRAMKVRRSTVLDMAERSGCHLRRESAEGGGDFFERGRALLLEPWFQLFYQMGEKVKHPFLSS